MNVRANPINLNAQLDAAYSAQKAAAKREAERTRKKLLEFASELAGESETGEACAVRREAGEEDRGDKERQNQQDLRKEQEEQASPRVADKSISDWA